MPRTLLLSPAIGGLLVLTACAKPDNTRSKGFEIDCTQASEAKLLEMCFEVYLITNHVLPEPPLPYATPVFHHQCEKHNHQEG